MKNIAKGYVANAAVIILLLIGFGMFQSMMIASGDSAYKLKTVPNIWQCCYLIIMATSLNLVLGFLGQLSLGHCGFMAIGAYTAALLSLACQRAGWLTDKEDASFYLVIVVAILTGGILAAIVGIIVGIPALRLRGDYLAIITLGFGMIIVNVINNLPFAGQQGVGKSVV